MAARKSAASHGGGGLPYDESEKFDPTREAALFTVIFNDPKIKYDALVYPQATLNSIGTKNHGDIYSHGRFSKSYLRQWVAKNLWAWFRSRKIDPGIGVRSVNQMPGFGIKFDVELLMDVKGQDEAYRIVVEEIQPKTFLLNILPITSDIKPAVVPKSTFQTVGHSTWSQIAVLNE